MEDRTFTQSALEVNATVTVEVSLVTGAAYTIEKAVIFTTGLLEDSVVFTTISYDQYTYTIV